ncbi:acetyl-CoA acetyltransferase [Nocardioides mangrovicus]|uniref:Acetyl-CoA acetyltransferase n=1 Tax=Nocardioides mangrovicus TaxID=2478913 RepID=A0A3L8NVT4_9ACTN|nr:acetyl-CoA acetyltransferase [Nocardioides mangrovicus]RLV47446.1 acetyl-CoA acetyltransferase [Nocardioides mangrovicus]
MSARDVVVIGVGQLRSNRYKDPAGAREPLDLVLEAARTAARDAGLTEAALAQLDAIGVVQVVSWAYDDVAGSVARGLGATHAKTFESGVGGHQPVAVLGDLAARIADGGAELALLCGGEAQSSLELLGAHQDPAAAAGWSHAPGGPVPFSRETGGTDAMWELGLVAPIRVYPLWENRLRYDLHQSFAESQSASAALYAGFSQVAADNPAAWNPQPVTAEEVAEVGPRNRMVCFPYPLLMNALNRVDQAAAVLLGSAEAADRLGLPAEGRVHVHATALDADCEDVLERASYSRAPGGERALDSALSLAEVSAAELDVVDLYSCFPVVPKLGRLHLNLDEELPLTATGGLTSFGGPHNDYSSHALVAVVHRLREGGGTGLVYAQGEYLTQHGATVLGTTPRPYAGTEATKEQHGPVPVDPTYTGPLTIETFTVEYDRGGAPARGFVLGRTPRGARTGLRVSSSDRATLEALVDSEAEAIGRTGRAVLDGDRRLFTLG